MYVRVRWRERGEKEEKEEKGIMGKEREGR